MTITYTSHDMNEKEAEREDSVGCRPWATSVAVRSGDDVAYCTVRSGRKDRMRTAGIPHARYMRAASIPDLGL